MNNKGDASTHIPNDAYRDHYDDMTWESAFNARKQHQAICKGMERRTEAQKLFDGAATKDMYREMRDKLTRPDLVEPDIDLETYNIMIQEGLERN